MLRTWSGPEGSSHMDLCLGVPFLISYENPGIFYEISLKRGRKSTKDR